MHNLTIVTIAPLSFTRSKKRKSVRLFGKKSVSLQQLYQLRIIIMATLTNELATHLPIDVLDIDRICPHDYSK